MQIDVDRPCDECREPIGVAKCNSVGGILLCDACYRLWKDLVAIGEVGEQVEEDVPDGGE